MDSDEILKDFLSTKTGYRCKQCGKIFPPQSKKALFKHRLKHFGIFFPCSECDNYSGRSEMALDRHMKKYHGRPDPKPYQCPYCKGAFRKEHMLQMHINDHTGERPFKCQECGMGFASIYPLRKHLKVMKHRGPRSGQVKDEDRIIPCAKCGMKFGKEDDLMQHMRNTKHPDKPTEWSTEDKELIEALVKTGNVKLKLGGKSLSCTKCNFKSIKVERTRKHMIKVHKEVINVKGKQNEIIQEKKEIINVKGTENNTLVKALIINPEEKNKAWESNSTFNEQHSFVTKCTPKHKQGFKAKPLGTWEQAPKPKPPVGTVMPMCVKPQVGMPDVVDLDNEDDNKSTSPNVLRAPPKVSSSGDVPSVFGAPPKIPSSGDVPSVFEAPPKVPSQTDFSLSAADDDEEDYEDIPMSPPNVPEKFTDLSLVAFVVSPELSGEIIGQGDRTINEIKKESGAFVEKSQHTISFVISGKKGEVESAKILINKVIKPYYFEMEDHNKEVVNGKLIENRTLFYLPTGLCRRILGKGSIEKIHFQSGALIQRDENGQVFTLLGNPWQIDSAKKLVTRALKGRKLEFFRNRNPPKLLVKRMTEMQDLLTASVSSRIFRVPSHLCEYILNKNGCFDFEGIKKESGASCCISTKKSHMNSKDETFIIKGTKKQIDCATKLLNKVIERSILDLQMENTFDASIYTSTSPNVLRAPPKVSCSGKLPSVFGAPPKVPSPTDSSLSAAEERVMKGYEEDYEDVPMSPPNQTGLRKSLADRLTSTKKIDDQPPSLSINEMKSRINLVKHNQQQQQQVPFQPEVINPMYGTHNFKDQVLPPSPKPMSGSNFEEQGPQPPPRPIPSSNFDNRAPQPPPMPGFNFEERPPQPPPRPMPGRNLPFDQDDQDDYIDDSELHEPSRGDGHHGPPGGGFGPPGGPQGEPHGGGPHMRPMAPPPPPTGLTWPQMPGGPRSFGPKQQNPMGPHPPPPPPGLIPPRPPPPPPPGFIPPRPPPPPPPGFIPPRPPPPPPTGFIPPRPPPPPPTGLIPPQDNRGPMNNYSQEESGNAPDGKEIIRKRSRSSSESSDDLDDLFKDVILTLEKEERENKRRKFESELDESLPRGGDGPMIDESAALASAEPDSRPCGSGTENEIQDQDAENRQHPCVLGPTHEEEEGGLQILGDMNMEMDFTFNDLQEGIEAVLSGKLTAAKAISKFRLPRGTFFKRLRDVREERGIPPKKKDFEGAIEAVLSGTAAQKARGIPLKRGIPLAKGNKADYYLSSETSQNINVGGQKLQLLQVNQQLRAEVDRLKSKLVAATQAKLAAVETAQAKLVAAETAEAKRVAAESTQAKLVEVETAQAKLVAAETAEAKCVAAKSTQAKLVAAESTQAKLVAAESTQAKLVAAESTQAKLVAAESTQAKLVAAESTQAKLVAAESTQTKLVAAESTQAKLVAAESTQTKLVEAESVQAELEAAESAQGIKQISNKEDEKLASPSASPSKSLESPATMAHALAPGLLVRSLACGGDSHMVKIWAEIEELLRQGDFPSLCVIGNGMRARDGSTWPMYFREQHTGLVECSADIILLCIGGNDIDDNQVNLYGVKDNVIRVVRELQEAGKTVFVLEVPRRFTTTATEVSVAQWKKLFNGYQRFCRRRYPSNYIGLPGGQHYTRESFIEEDLGRGVLEIVHFDRDHYVSYARHILQILHGNLSKENSNEKEP